MPGPATCRRRPYPTAGSSKRAFPATNNTGTDPASCRLLHRSWLAPGSFQRRLVDDFGTLLRGMRTSKFHFSPDRHGPLKRVQDRTMFFDKALSLIHISEPTRLGMISYA